MSDTLAISMILGQFRRGRHHESACFCLGLRYGFRDHVIIDAAPAQAFHHQLSLIALQFGQVATKALAHVGPEQRLVTGKPASSFRSSITSSGIRRLMVDIGRSFRNLFRTRLFILVAFPFHGGRRTRRDDADGVRLTRDVEDERQRSVFSKSDGGLPCLALAAGIGQPHEGIEEDLTVFLEAHALLAQICGGLGGVQLEGLPVNIYVVDGESSRSALEASEERRRGASHPGPPQS